MSHDYHPLARSVLAHVRSRYRPAVRAIVLISALLNVIALAGSIYMMLVYDFVLPSHSGSTLFGLLVILILVYGLQAVLDQARGGLLAALGAALGRDLIGRVQDAVADAALRNRSSVESLQPVRDLDQLRSFLSSNGPAGLIDLPWVLFFLAVLALFNIWLGVTALGGAAILVVLTVATDRATREPSRGAMGFAMQRAVASDLIHRHIEEIHVLGMRGRIKAAWDDLDRGFLAAQLRLAAVSGKFGGMSRIFRTFLQSAVLTVGALLVLDGKATAGVIFASSILSARALAPIDQSIANWRNFILARQAWRRLDIVMAQQGIGTPAVAMPRPTQGLAVENLTLVPPGADRPVVVDVSFTATAGDALCVLGASASGKSSLMRGLVGFWPAFQGKVRLDGAALDQWSQEALGPHIGFMPQRVALLDGSIAQNICRFEGSPPEGAIIAAARAANVHDMILRLPRGYDTYIGTDGMALSAGQLQRIGLARALYRDPFLVVLDEPNSNLDAEGDAALLGALQGVRARGGLAVIVAHRPNMLAVANLVLLMEGGRLRAFGKKEEVLPRILAAPPTPPQADTPNGPMVSHDH